jgi:hypothetical protein
MTLGDLIDLLKENPGQVLRPGLDHPHSWRGVYEQLAFEPCDETTTDSLLCAAVAAIGGVFEGYKGGHYEMTRRTPINIERWDNWSDGGEAAAIIHKLDPGLDVEGRTLEWLTRKAIDLMLANGKLTPWT